MRHIGIDPGLSGAIAVLTDDTLQIHDMPVMTVDRNGKAKRQVSANELAELLNLYAGKDCHVYCERVSAMAGQGVTSVFSFGRSFGMIEESWPRLRCQSPLWPLPPGSRVLAVALAKMPAVPG